MQYLRKKFNVMNLRCIFCGSVSLLFFVCSMFIFSPNLGAEDFISSLRQEARDAAIIANQKLGMVTKHLLEKMYSVNVFAVIDMLQIASRLMARNGGGCFVNIASITGVVGSPGQVAYSSTKGAVIALTKSAAKELSPMNIRVNAVAPGIIATERFKELYECDGIK